MKVMHVCLTGPYTDGWNYQDNLITKYQRLEGVQVGLVAPKWIWNSEGGTEYLEKDEYYDEYGVHIFRLPMKGKENINNRFKRYKKLYKTINDYSPDIIFVHGCQFIDSKVIVDYVKEHRITLYVDNHADFSNSGKNWISKNILHKLFWKHFAQKLVPYTKKFYGVLPARVDFLVDIYKIPKNKCELLVMGADDELVAKAAQPAVRSLVREKHNISADDFLIITGGKIDKWKAQTILLMQAVSEIKRENVKLIVFGSVDEHLAQKVHALSDGDKVQYIGWIQSNDSYQYFASSDLAVFPGRHSVFWEQVAGQGIPMIVKEWDGTKHVDLGGNVLFIESQTADEIKKAIESLLLDKEKYAHMKAIAETKGMEEFSYRKIAMRSIGL